MENVKMTVVKDRLTIEVDLKHEGDVSDSGKTVRVASTEGNVNVPGTDVTIGLNLYRKNPDYKKSKSGE